MTKLVSTGHPCRFRRDPCQSSPNPPFHDLHLAFDLKHSTFYLKRLRYLQKSSVCAAYL